MIHDYGFRWGPANVSRIIHHRLGKRELYVLQIKTDHHNLQVSVSGKGRSVRAWLDGTELTVA